ncbi:hypothetical protein F9L00_14350 [Brucella anthropi]|uniref:Uncharacterized protein n=1 Tax=Brucella haematophila TaxID=419474 RepID=A0ABX1DKA1_9HYPH|nr:MULTISPECIES: hypothetical protein [Brucella]KAB2776512.1 hypothetical protein F9L00_14350 [Brucella anthropi]NKC02440.1 hypothetical protein [Brucella haematophila]TMV03097.1 hypothetical protein FGI60_11820 [Brucella haematophila]WKT94524.1 hypothetical protein QYR01_10495 [Brucella anthropi]
MSHIKTEYRGHTIAYGENSDEWHCLDVNFASASLLKVKSRIDKMYLDMRKQSAVDVFEMSKGGVNSMPVLTPSLIVDFVKTKLEKSFYGRDAEPVEKHIVAVAAQRAHSTKVARREANINELMPSTPAAERAWGEYLIACEGLRAAHAKAERAYRAIPRVSLEDVAALKAIKDSQKDADNE